MALNLLRGKSDNVQMGGLPVLSQAKRAPALRHIYRRDCHALAALEQKGLDSWANRNAAAPQGIWGKIRHGSLWILGRLQCHAQRECDDLSPYVAYRPR